MNAHDEAEAEITSFVRGTIVQMEGSIFPLLARHREGRAQLRRHQEVALSRLDSHDPEERKFAVWMLWRCTTALESVERFTRHERKPKPAPKPADMHRIAELAELGQSLLLGTLTCCGDDTSTILRADIREACYRFQRIAELARPKRGRSRTK